MTDTVTRGVITQKDAYFYEDNGITPQYCVGGVSYVISAFNNLTIATGIAEQDQVNLARWKVTFSIPENAPITGPNDQYTLLWRAKRSDNGYNQQVNKFAVVDELTNETDLLNDGAVIGQVGMPLTLSLRVPDGAVRSLSLRIIPSNSDNPLVTLTNLTDINGNSESLIPIPDGNYYRYSLLLNTHQLAPLNSYGTPGGFVQWYAYYNYTDSNGQDQTVINPIYMVNSTLVFILDSINKYVNLLRNQDVVKQLQINETMLIHFAIQGLLRVNATSPANFGFDFNSLNRGGSSFNFTYWVIKCAQLELLNALYLGEGMSAFEFSGMTVQLNSDRTQYISQAISTIENDIASNLSKTKSQYGRAGGGSGRMGTIAINFGPVTNWGYGSFGVGNNLNNSPLGYGGTPLLPFFTLNIEILNSNLIRTEAVK